MPQLQRLRLFDNIHRCHFSHPYELSSIYDPHAAMTMGKRETRSVAFLVCCSKAVVNSTTMEPKRLRQGFWGKLCFNEVTSSAPFNSPVTVGQSKIVDQDRYCRTGEDRRRHCPFPCRFHLSDSPRSAAPPTAFRQAPTPRWPSCLERRRANSWRRRECSSTTCSWNMFRTLILMFLIRPLIGWRANTHRQ